MEGGRERGRERGGREKERGRERRRERGRERGREGEREGERDFYTHTQHCSSCSTLGVKGYFSFSAPVYMYMYTEGMIVIVI